MQVFGRDQKQHETRMSNIEQGISNHEVEPSLPLPSVFDILRFTRLWRVRF
jgi:hypothetical protein